MHYWPVITEDFLKDSSHAKIYLITKKGFYMLNQLFAVSYSYSSQTSGSGTGISLIFTLLILAAAVLVLISMWKLFVKAGKPGWAAIVPFYNAWVLSEIGGKPGWWGLAAGLLSIIPIVGPIAGGILFLLISIGVAKNFGKDTIYGVIMLWLLGFVGYPMLAFGSAKYKAVK